MKNALLYLIFFIILLLLCLFKEERQVGGNPPWYFFANDPDLLPGPISSGTTKNMSYDIRGDPYIPFHAVSPWYNPTSFPIRNRVALF